MDTKDILDDNILEVSGDEITFELDLAFELHNHADVGKGERYNQYVLHRTVMHRSKYVEYLYYINYLTFAITFRLSRSYQSDYVYNDCSEYQ